MTPDALGWGFFFAITTAPITIVPAAIGSVIMTNRANTFVSSIIYSFLVSSLTTLFFFILTTPDLGVTIGFGLTILIACQALSSLTYLITHLMRKKNVKD